MKINPEFKKVAIFAAKEAGRILENNFRKNNVVYSKKDGSPFTKADLGADKIITNIIKNNFPSHGIISEESKGKSGDEYTWFIDPLDGTSNYIIGLPLFSVGIALLKNKKIIVAVVFNPISKELYFAEKGAGAFLNGKRIKVNKVSNLSKALLYFNRGKDLISGLKILIKIAPRLRTFRFHGSAHFDACKIAEGKGEGFFAVKPAFYDVGAGAFIVEEAGGKAADFKGNEYSPDSPNVIVTNGKIHSQLLKLINK